MPQLVNVDVFVSYNSKDRKLVEAICNNLERRKVGCYLDIKQFQPGQPWLNQFNAIADKVGAVFFFVGQQGLGEWQEEELRYLHINSHNLGTNLIPVCIDGAQVPNRIELTGRVRIDFGSDAHDPLQLDLLELAVKGKLSRPLGVEYTIHVAVRAHDPSKRTCFLAMGRDGDARVHKALEEVAAQSTDPNLSFVESNEYAEGGVAPMNYDPSSIHAVRTASVVVADGTVVGEFKKPHPDVMFVLGLAHAVGKPIVLVTDGPLASWYNLNPKEPVVYERDKLEDEESTYKPLLASRISKAISHVLEEQRSPYLVGGHDEDVTVTYADVFYSCAIYWRLVRQILSVELCVQRALREASSILEHLHTTNLIFFDDIQRLKPKGDEVKDQSWSRIQQAYTQFQADHDTRLVPRLDDVESRQIDAQKAFNVLLRASSGRVAMRLDDSQRHFGVAMRLLKRFRTGCNELRRRNERDPSEEHQDFVIYLDEEIRTQTSTISNIEAESSQMMFGLLELIDSEPQIGGTQHE